jgi:hypothetical protein
MKTKMTKAAQDELAQTVRKRYRSAIRMAQMTLGPPPTHARA